MMVSPLDKTKVLNPIAYGVKYSDCPNCKNRHLIEWVCTDPQHKYYKDGYIVCPENNTKYKVVHQNHWLLKPLEPYKRYTYCDECVHLITNHTQWFPTPDRNDYFGGHDTCRKCEEERANRKGMFFKTLDQYKKDKKERIQADKLRAIQKTIFLPNRYIVVYGEVEAPKEDQDNGYTYYFEGELNLGDIVQVPKTWLGDLKGDDPGPKLATVVSLKSNYHGSVSSIIRVVKNINERI